MPRRRIRPWASQCIRLRPMDLIRACGTRLTDPIRPRLLGLPRTGFEPYPVVVVPLEHYEDEGSLTYGLSFRVPPFDPEAEPAIQVVSVIPVRDMRGRRRYYFHVREPGGRQRTETLYLAPGNDRFFSRHALQVTFRAFPPVPLGLTAPWDPVAGHLIEDCRQLARAARELLAQFPGSQAQQQAREEAKRRSTRGLRAARRRWLALRQKAVAHLWGMCGWEPEQLAALFGVHERSINRDLTAARKLGDAPRQRVRKLAPRLVAQAKELLARCRALSSAIWRIPEDLLWRYDREVWGYSMCARLLKEEVRLTQLLARLGEVQPATFPHWCHAKQLDGMLEPRVLEAAEKLIADHMRRQGQAGGVGDGQPHVRRSS